MSGALKIRLLLFVLALAFAGTAITLNLTFNKEEILNQDARQIQDRLQQKEKFVNDILNDKAVFDSLKTLPHNPA